MKTTDFINESFVEDAAAAHQDHEVQMARGDCYNAAKYAIELHKLLKNISEQQGLDGWVSEKITLANDYLRTVTEYLRYEQQSGSSSDMPDFDVRSATQTLDSVLGESAASNLQENAFTWYLKAHGRLLTPATSDTPYQFKSKEEAVAFAKQKYKTNWQNIVPTTYNVANSLADQPDPGWDEEELKPVKEDDYDDAVAAFLTTNKPTVGKTHKPRKAERLGGSKHIGAAGGKGTSKGKVSGLGANTSPKGGKPVVTAEDDKEQTKNKPAVVKTNKPIGSRVADIGPGGKEYNVKTNKAWDDQHKEVDEERTVTRDETGKIIAWRDESDWRRVDKDKDGRGKVANLSDKARRETEKLQKDQGVDEGKADPVGSWVVYGGGKAKRFKTRDGAKAYAAKNGGKVASSEYYHDNIQKQGMAEDMSRAAKGHEKYGKEGMQALAKAGREGASEKELDTIRDKHDRYDEDLSEEAKKGLYYYVNKRKKAGTSRDADHPKAPSPQDWKNAAKTAKKESVAETTSSGSVATSMGGGNGFANGGPGTIARPRMKKKK